MRLKPIASWLLGTVAAMSLCARAEAGDIGPANGARAPSKLNQQIDQAIGSAGTSSSDIDSRVKDLESTRASIDQKKPPTVSLSVSGWVGQQVQYDNSK
jgi:hypothetical protein